MAPPWAADYVGDRSGTIHRVDTDGRAWFAQRAATASPAACAGATQRVDLRRAAAAWPATEATAFAQARAVLHWHARHRHCGDCGAELAFVRGGWLGHCLGCGSEH